MPRLPFVIISLLICAIYLGQPETMKWHFGNGAAINFSGASPSVMSGCAITTSMGCSSISNSLGNTLFYTDGVNVYNQANAIMPNGAGLPGSDAFQSALILKKPSSSTLYYVFTVGALAGSNGLYYSIVDMSLAAGMGSVTIKNVLIHPDCRDKLTAGRHCNGTDLWVLSAAYNSTVAFVAAQLTSAGISTVVLSPVSTALQAVIGSGQIRISPNSHKVGVVSYKAPGTTCGVDVRILNFDNSTGVVLNTGVSTLYYSTYGAPNINCGNTFYGCEFSRDSRFMYTSNISQVMRVDLCALPFISTGLIPNAENSLYDTVSKRSMQMAPDGRIYIAKNGKTSLGAINNPSSLMATTFSSLGLSLNTYTCNWGLPNFPAYLFEQKPPSAFSYTLSSGNCLTAFFTSPGLCAGSGYSVSGYQWDFGEPSSAASNTSTLSNPIHFYSSPGTYSVTMIRYFNCNDNDTIRQVINVTAPTINILNSPSLCNVTTATAQVSASSGTLNYLWSSGSQTTAIANFSASGIYTVTVTDPGTGYCTVTATTAITVVNLTTTANSTSVICNGGSNGSATVSVSGGSGNYFYGWIGASSGGTTATNLSAGTYTINILDNVNFCTQSVVVNVPQPSSLQLSVGSPTATCVNQTISLYSSTSGGTPTYSVNWVGIGNTPNAMSSQSMAGTYIYTCNVNDAHLCQTSKTIGVIFNPNPNLSVSAATLCAGSNLTLVANGASSYSWSSGSTSNSVTLIQPMSGTLGLTGNLGICTQDTVITIVNFALPNLSLTANSPLCSGQTLSLTSIGQGTVNWTGPASFNSSLTSLNIPSVTIIQTGTYSAVLTDSNTCMSTNFVNVIVYALPNMSISAAASICVGGSTTLSVLGTDTYSWSTGQSSSVIIVNPLQTTSYQTIGTSTITGCSNTKTVSVTVLECLDLQENKKENWSVYPNPAHEILMIRAAVFAKYIITNSMGQELKSGNCESGENEIMLQELVPGCYNLQIIGIHDRRNVSLIIE